MKITQSMRGVTRIEQARAAQTRRIGSCSLLFAAICGSASAVEIDVPSVAVTTVNQAESFSATEQNVIALTGSLNGGDSVTVTASSGTFSLSATTGLTFTVGDGTSDSTMTFTGSLADVNAALLGSSFTPANGVAGTASLSISVSGTQSASSSLSIAVNATMDAEAARDTILTGVTSLADPTQPGYMVVYGDNAYSITNYPGGNIDDPMVAAATWGAGKVLAMPDHQWLNMGNYGSDASTGTFYKNSLTWLTGSNNLGNKIVVYNNQATADWLAAEGYTNVVHTNASNLASDLVGADALVAGWIGTSINASMSTTIRDYVTGGGAMFISEYGPGYSWWWGKSTEDVPANILLREAGIGFLQNYPHGGVQNINRASTQMTAEEVLAIIQDPVAYTETEKNLAASIFDKLNAVLKENDPLQKRFDEVFWSKIATINPTPASPVSDSLEKALLNREGQILRDLPVAQMTAHRTALPVGASAARVNKTFSVPATVAGHDYWVIDTGMYAAPGEIINITVPAAMVGNGTKVQVGHLRTDTGDTNYYTMPYQQVFFDVDATSIQVASPHGGLIMFVAPSGTEWTGAQSTQINGAIEAPYFEYGVTTNAEWVAGIRDRETPFGVLVSDTAVLVIESEQYLRTLDNPDGVMEIHRNSIWWLDDFYNYHRGRPLRTHHDYQPVGGASSMPLSYGIGSDITNYENLVVHNEALTLHEHGHHADHGNLIFSEFGETTPNMGGKYAQQMYMPFSWKQELAVGRINNYQRSLTDNLWNHYSHYAVDVKGTFVDSLGEVFGWNNIRTIVHLISGDSSISSDQDKKDAWLIHTSQTVGYDVSDFLEAWQITFSAEALTTVGSLPKWNMVETVSDDLVVKENTPITFHNPMHNDFSYDGTLTFGGITSPANGAIVDNGDGTFTYTPNNGFTGDDNVQYTVNNGTGNNFTKEIKISVNAAASHPVLESGDTHASTTGWTTVTLDQSFSSMVVVAQPILPDGVAPVVTRIRNASGNSFEVMLQRVDGQSGDINNLKVRYLAVEEGVYNVADHGIKMEAVKYSSTVTDTAGSFVGETRTMAHNSFDHYFIPTVYGQVMSYNDSNWSAFWYKQNADKLQLGKHVGEDSNTTRANETVAYIIMEAGSFQVGDYLVQTGGLGYDGYNGFSGLSSGTASHDFTRFPSITSGLVAADISVPWGGSNPGDEGFWVVQKPAGVGNRIAATIIEDQIGDAEQDAGNKGGSYLLVSYTGDKPVTGDDTAVALEGFSTLIDVLGNDDSGASLSISGFTQPANGTVVANGDGTLTYTPNANYTGPDFFTYTTSNGSGTDTAVVSIDVQASAVSQPGLLREKWTSIGGGNISDLTGNANYPDSPNSSSIINSFEAPTGDGDSYGQRVRGLLVPPTSGDYTFWIASDDDGDFYLSTDHSAVNASRVAYVDGWTGEKSWTQKSSQTSAVISLEAGKAYYVEAIHKEGGGGDHLAVAWQGPGITQAVIANQYLHTLGNNGPSVANAIADVQVNENAADTVIDLSAVFADIDPGDALTLAVAGNTNDSLVSATLNGTQLTLSYAAGQSGTASISVRATDRLNTVVVDSFQVEVVANNMAPSLADATFSVAEDAAVAAAVGTVVGSDPDAGDSLSYSILSGNTGGAFAINSSTGALTVATSLNYEAVASYTLTVQVQDAGGLTDTATVTVNVTDVDESGLNGVAAWEEAVNAGTAFAHKRTQGLAGNATASVDMSVLSGSATYEFVVEAEDLGQAALHLLDASGWSLRFEQWNNSGNLGVTRYGVADYQLSAEAGASIASPYGNLHHVVYAVDSTNTLTSVYVNGSLVGTVAQVPLINAANATLGDSNMRSDSSTGIHAFAAYNAVLGASEIGDHYNAWVGNLAPTASDANFSIAEDASNGSAVGTVVANDPNPNTNLSYAITAGNTGGAFAIHPSTGAITTAAGLDYESVSQYVLTVTVSDDAAPSLNDTASITIDVSNINEAPSLANSNAAVAENGSAGVAVATVSGSDPDTGDSLSYAITAGNTGNAFSIDANTGAVTTSGGLDTESVSQYVLSISVTDAGGLSDTATLTVDVTNVNEAPVANDTSGSVDENQAGGVLVATVAASDVDAGDSLSYAITAGNVGNLFSIDTNGQVTTTAGLDYESATSYSLTVSVTDAGGLSDTATVSVNVNDLNEAPSANDAVASLAEGTGLGTLVTSVSASDPDAGNSLSYAITAGNAGGAFAINSSNGEITTSGSLDYETQSQYVLTVSATDGGGLSDSATVTVDITNVNEQPVANDGTYGIAENAAADTVLGTVVASDPDAGDTLSYAISAGDPDGLFAIDSASGAISLVGALDYETTASYNLTVSVTDAGALADTANYTLNVTDSSEAALAHWKFDETSGSVAADASGNGHDGSVSGAAWVSGQSANALSFDGVDDSVAMGTGPSLQGKVPFTLSAWIKVPNGSSATQQIIQQRDPGGYNGEYMFRVDSNGAVRFTLYRNGYQFDFATTDVVNDGQWHHVAAVRAGNKALIYIDGVEKASATGAARDLIDTIGVYVGVDGRDSNKYFAGEMDDVRVHAIALSAAEIGTVMNDLNAPPVANDTSGSVAEDATLGTTVATVSASDPDAGDSLSYAITAGNTGGAFAIDNSGVITTATALDYETTNSYTLTVTVTDNGGLSDTASVAVSVTDVLEVTAAVVATGSASNLAMTSADLGYSITDEGGEAPSVTLYYGETDGGTTPASWSNSVVLGTKNVGAHVESVTGLSEGTSYYYTIAATNTAGTVWGSSASFTTVADTSPKMVRTTVSGVSSSSWTSVDLGKNYNSAVIVATPIYANAAQVPVVTRIRNVSGSSFEVKLDRADGLTAAVSCDVSVIAVEEGVYTLASDGVQMEAVKFTSMVTAAKSSWLAEARSYTNSYTTPVVLGQVMSANDANWSVFWSMGNTRTAPADASNLNIGKHVAEDSNKVRADETIGYIVIEAGTGSINGVAYSAGLGADSIQNTSNNAAGYSYNISGLTSASSGALSSAAMDGNDGGWPVFFENDALSASAIKLIIEEDDIGDSESSHTSEQVNYLIFE
ncbi:cadherin domain-containing protein [Rubritalea tangerina]|uniref:Cadherin domain-containing protein n=1 Tax=Rubritalea tangerina TaxID=430798 RepID=A0ABW4ZAC3_9BACT